MPSFAPMDTDPDVSVSEPSASPATSATQTPVPEIASADAQATADAARLVAERHAQVLSAMQAAQDAVVSAVRGMTRPPATDA